MPAKLSGLVDKTSGGNLQMVGHAAMPSQSAKDLQESEAMGSSPSHSPSWSSARRLLSSHPNTTHCLEIYVTLTEQLGAVLPASHSWTSPLVEDMLCDIRTRFTKAVARSPGRAVLFYGRHSMGEDKLWTRLKMPHSYSQEQVCGLENWPTCLWPYDNPRR